jgi:RNA methyltransferase, TrmH family
VAIMPADDADPAREITSPANPRVKWLVSLRKRRTRDAEHVTVVEGLDELTMALDAGVRPRQVFWCAAMVSEPARSTILDRVADLGSETVALGAAAFAKASYRESPDGWLGVVADPASALEQIVLGPRPMVLVCEAIEKPGNLGAILRTAEAAGVDAVIAASPVADWGNPNVVRASKGTVFAVPVASAPAADVVSWSSPHGLTIVVATPDADVLITDLDLSGPVAIVVGAEHAGVSGDLLGVADVRAALPMYGRVNSLNVATSAAIAVYEAVRQRGLHSLGPTH